MHYIRIDTQDGETRWINLAQVSRVTSAVEVGTDDEILVLFFADGCPDTTLRLHGGNESDRAAIKVVRSNLDTLVTESCSV